MKKKIILMCTILISIITIFTIVDDNPTFADSGFGTSYDSGSSYSGSYSSDYGYSSSSDDYWDKDSDTEPTDPFVTFAILLVSIIIFIVIFIKNSSAKNKVDIPNYIDINDTRTEQTIQSYIPDFNKEYFLQDGYNIYYKVQEAWMNFKLDDVKDIITNQLYSMYSSQLETLKVKGEQNIMQDFVLKKSFLKDAIVQNNILTVKTGYIIEFYDYIIEQLTGEVVRGFADRKVRITYEMSFRKTLDESKKVTKCPNCGAEIKMNATGICDYCHTKLVTDNTEWVLTEKQTINQEYV